MPRLFPFGLLLVTLAFAGCSGPSFEPAPPPAASSTVPTASPSPAPALPETPSSTEFFNPLFDGQARVTKKPFGIYITPATSPVSPERFSGYHTGMDLEAFRDEANQDVTVYAICAGPLRQKRTASGYGGIAVQACEWKGEPITVVYGHLDLASIEAEVGSRLEARQPFALLGDVGPETDGERKHLHLGIHRRTAINVRGYVSTKEALADWIDPMLVVFTEPIDLPSPSENR